MEKNSRKLLRGIAAALREASGSPKKNRFTTAVIVAAGRSERMGGDIPKQFITLDGIPAAAASLRAYNESAYIDAIVAVVRPEDVESGIYAEFREKYALGKLVSVVAGGSTRQESVLRGIEEIASPSSPGASVLKKTEYVAIADAARPLTTPEDIDRVCIAACRFEAATAACRAVDSVKVADSHGFIDSSIDRKTVWLAATPQVFSLPLYRAAAYSALEEGFEGSDDNELVEHMGHAVKIVEIGRYNIKLTRPEDPYVAAALAGYLKKKAAEEYEQSHTAAVKKTGPDNK